METSKGNTRPFLVRIWLEETAEEARQPSWRGQTTHVPSGKRRTFSRLPEMTAFIVPYLESMGVRSGLWSRVGQRLAQGRCRNAPSPSG